MQTSEKKSHFLLASLFGLVGVVFLGIGGWNVHAALAVQDSLAGAVIALVFLALFALVSIAYGFFLWRDARAGKESGQGIAARVHPVKVLSLLAYGIVPLLYLYYAGEMRDLHAQRGVVFAAIRPAFMEYVARNGRVPRTLDLLVPDYLPAIPEILRPREPADSVKGVRYVAAQMTARFYYKTAVLPPAEGFYDILDDRYGRVE